MKQLTLIFIILLAGGSAYADQGLELFTPPPFLSTSKADLYLVGKTSAPLVEIYLNGEKAIDLQVKDSIFHGKVKFGYGLNELEIMPIYSGLIETAEISVKIEVLCGPDVTGRYARLYPKYLFHDQRSKEACLGCHDPNLDGPLPAQNNSACLSCHSSLLTIDPELKESKHEHCDACHKLGPNLLSLASNIGYFEESTCFNCHENKRRDFGQEYIHGPVAVGSCTICHDPHGSRHEHALVTAEEILCFSCHDFQLELKEMPVQHNPFRRGMCGSCHDPHSTNNKWVLVKSSVEVCMGCHNEVNGGMSAHKHPYNVEPKRKLTSNLQLSDDGRLECLSCHNPHASRVQHLLRTDQEFTCSGCHADKTN